MSQTLSVLAKRPKLDYETETHWMRVGFATAFDDGNIVVTVNATPLNWDGQLKIVPRWSEPRKEQEKKP